MVGAVLQGDVNEILVITVTVLALECITCHSEVMWTGPSYVTLIGSCIQPRIFPFLLENWISFTFYILVTLFDHLFLFWIG